MNWKWFIWDLIGAHYELNIRQFWVKNYCDMREAYRHLQQKRKKYEPMTKRRLDGCHLESASFFTFHKTGWSHTTGVAPFWTCQLVNNWTIIQLLSQFLLYSSSFLLDKTLLWSNWLRIRNWRMQCFHHSFEPSSHSKVNKYQLALGHHCNALWKGWQILIARDK